MNKKTDIWMPFYVSDYLADTQDLSCQEHGAYVLLLLHGWMHEGRIPADDARLARITKLSVKEWRDVRPTILSFFNREGDRLTQKRQIAELQKALGIRAARSVAGAMGAAQKWGGEPTDKQKRSERLAEARAKGTHSAAEWEALLDICGSKCLRCGASTNVIKDHITPLYQGGADSIDNLQPLCRSCTCSKGPDSTDLRPANWRQALAEALSKGVGKRLSNACQTPAPGVGKRLSNACQTPAPPQPPLQPQLQLQPQSQAQPPSQPSPVGPSPAQASPAPRPEPARPRAVPVTPAPEGTNGHDNGQKLDPAKAIPCWPCFKPELDRAGVSAGTLAKAILEGEQHDGALAFALAWLRVTARDVRDPTRDIQKPAAWFLALVRSGAPPQADYDEAKASLRLYGDAETGRLYGSTVEALKGLLKDVGHKVQCRRCRCYYWTDEEHACKPEAKRGETERAQACP